MPELIRSIASRLREFVGNRRRAPRYKAQLEAGLALILSTPHAKPEGDKKGRSLKLAGYTRDVSSTGLALVVPSIRIGGQYIMGENRTLEIVLKLPADEVTIKAAPVRYRPLEDDGANTGYLIGVQITSMSDEDQARFNAYLATLG
jgi:hypothetical protein